MRNKIVGIFLLLFLMTPLASAAVDLSEEISTDDEAAFDEILEPVMDVYNFVKYVATVVAALVLVGAGILFMMSGSNSAKREQAKNMVMYVVVGLIIIWVAPFVVEFFTS